ncbi:MAG: aminotransferase class I/II-fold pyridoxal phosphate-dependent enzyme [Alphaproteobacteria bacterium]|nr:aminotransferase class I/II-fold pyridoxal phosphate-dependent enzyme [Alphaproteobacteria bacterium]
MNDLPPRTAALPPSPFLRLTALLGTTPPGEPPIALSVGEPQGPVPGFVAEILARETAGFSKYPPIQGTDALRKAIAGWLTRRYRLAPGAVDPETMVLPLNGTREGLFMAHFVVVPERKAGGRPAVLMPNPFYSAYPSGALASGAEPVYVNALKETGFLPAYGELPAETLERTALAIIASPSNPEGAVAGLEDWKTLFALADRYGFAVFADECYSEIYTGATPPLGALEAAQRLGRGFERLLVFNSLSKRSGLAGLRSGFVAGDPKLIARYRDLRSNAGPQLSGPLQAVSAHAWGDDVHVAANQAIYRANFAVAQQELGNRPFFRMPDGGFFLWLETGNGVATAETLWRTAGLRVVPGAFLANDAGIGRTRGNPGTNFIRLALVNAEETTRAALRRLARVLPGPGT